MITYRFNKEDNSLVFYDGEMIVSQNAPFSDEESALEYAPIKAERLNKKFGYTTEE